MYLKNGKFEIENGKIATEKGKFEIFSSIPSENIKKKL